MKWGHLESDAHTEGVHVKSEAEIRTHQQGEESLGWPGGGRGKGGPPLQHEAEAGPDNTLILDF